MQSVVEAPRGTEEIVLWRDHNRALGGVAYFGLHAVIAATDAAAIDAFAVEVRRHARVRSIVGRAEHVERLWSRLRDWHPAPTIVRERQPLYVLVPEALVAPDRVPIRRAQAEEAERVATNNAEMMIGELGYDPRARRGFAANVRRAIEHGLWWVWVHDGELRFQCNVGARTARTAQLQGVWTPPELRGRGYGRMALGSITAALLEESPTLSLYVNDFNTRAIGLYERLGYAQVATFATYLFSP